MTTKWTTDQVRTTFLKFFASKKHLILPSAALVPHDDPSLLWINSGVATLKPYFDGRKTPPAPRLTNSQKAIRTNDIENVGITARHQTFFEMLGNFAIGDYFKKEAIIWAWEFLTSKTWLNLAPKNFYITVFEEDQETYDLWLNTIKIPQDHLIKGTRTTNFWDMGQGPCGPNTEIYYDRGEKYDPQKIGIKLLTADLENDRYLEIWNIVFSQFNNDGNNNYVDLPRKNIDTGAGLERLVTILQAVPTNFDTDLFQTIIHECEKLTTFRYEINNYFQPVAQQTITNSAFKVIADHLRCLVFAINDGAFPSNKDRGYVLRRLVRRAVVYGQKLNINEPFLSKLVSVVVQVMGNHYQELHDKITLITTIIDNEELKFWTTLTTGKQLLQQVINQEGQVTASVAFKLFDTYGYPIELITEIAQEQQVKVDITGFQQLLAKSKDITRKTRINHQALAIQSPLLTNLKIPTTFVGYNTEVQQTTIAFMFKNDQQVTTLTSENGYLILTETPFYAEKGGQTADDGTIIGAKGMAYVLDVQEGPNKMHLHHVEVNGQLQTAEVVQAQINQIHRFYTQKNHSGTHLLHAALRKLLGKHVVQSGSFNNYQYLRLDFSHYQMLTTSEIIALEAQIATWINDAYPCEVFQLNYQAAIKMGALAFFGEKYDSIVRVVKFGDFSIELCGGTHCQNSKAVEALLITSVEAKGSGIYRIHALTSMKTINNYLNEQISNLKKQSHKLYQQYQAQQNHQNHDLAIENKYQKIQILAITANDWRQGKLLLLELQNLSKKWQIKTEDATRKQLTNQFLNLIPQKYQDYDLLLHQFQQMDLKILKDLTDHYRNQYEKIIVIFINQLKLHENLVLVAVSKTLNDNPQYHSNVILQKILKLYHGKGGGTPSLSQGKVIGEVKASDIIKILS